MLKVKSLSKSFSANAVIKDISFDLKIPELVGLVGPSNGGKSVLIKLLGGIMEPDSGSVVLNDDGENDNKQKKYESLSSDTIGFSFQEEALFDSMSVIENVAFPLLVHKSSSYDEAIHRANEILTEVGLAQAINKLPGQLSGGMRRRVAIARALVGKPKLAFLDDPTAGLDPVAASVIMNLIKKLYNEYETCMVVVSHDIRRLLPNVERVLALFDGQIVYDGVPRELLSNSTDRVISFLSTRFDFSIWQDAKV